MDRALLPGIIGGAQQVFHFRTKLTANPENRWTGSNRGAYSNPEIDRLGDELDVALEPSEIIRLSTEYQRIIRSDLPVRLLYYDATSVAAIAGLKGPRVSKSNGETKNIYEWYWEI
jgi:ABC-type transport system substrate-binding protein